MISLLADLHSSNKNCKTRNRGWLWFMRTCGIPWHLNHWHQKDHCYVSDITYILNCCKVCLCNVIQQFRHGGLLVAYRVLEHLHSLAGNRGQGQLPISNKREMVQLDNVISYTDNLQNHTIWKGEGGSWVGGWVGSLGTRPSKNRKGGSGTSAGVEMYTAPGMKAHFRLAFD